MKRINYLDGHRGVAILLVFFFHAYARWAELMPFGSQYADFPVFKYGYLGVQLFFLISGFVIFMSLEKSRGLLSFIYRRWLRLFPAMLICTVIVFLSSSFFHERPSGQPELIDTLAGLSFLEPYLWQKLFGVELSSIEGAFWSLYVEFKFYLIGSIFFFIFGTKWFVHLIFLCFLMFFGVEIFHQFSSNYLSLKLESVASILSFQYFGWFAAGAAFYLFHKSDNKQWFIIGVVYSIASSFAASKLNFDATWVAALFISAFFALSIVSQTCQQFLGNRIVLFFGFISYPLYLIHENMMVSISLKLSKIADFAPPFLYPLIALAFVSLIAYVVAKLLEPRARTVISGIFDRMQGKA